MGDQTGASILPTKLKNGLHDLKSQNSKRPQHLRADLTPHGCKSSCPWGMITLAPIHEQDPIYRPGEETAQQAQTPTPLTLAQQRKGAEGGRKGRSPRRPAQRGPLGGAAPGKAGLLTTGPRGTRQKQGGAGHEGNERLLGRIT